MMAARMALALGSDRSPRFGHWASTIEGHAHSQKEGERHIALLKVKTLEFGEREVLPGTTWSPPKDREKADLINGSVVGAGEGNRTLVCSLGSCRSTIELRPQFPFT
jgi:hypothetical protein